MKTRLRLLIPVVTLLGACAHQDAGELKPSPESSSAITTQYVGLTVASLPSKEVGGYMSGVLNALNKSLAEGETTQWTVVQLTDGTIYLRAPATTGFETGSAELRPSALESLNQIARVATAYNKTTVHILVNGYDVTAAAFSQSLADRRAATLAVYLNRQGVDNTRMRNEGSVKTRVGFLQIVIKPVIAGAEPQAWMSPS